MSKAIYTIPSMISSSQTLSKFADAPDCHGLAAALLAHGDFLSRHPIRGSMCHKQLQWDLFALRSYWAPKALLGFTSGVVQIEGVGDKALCV